MSIAVQRLDRIALNVGDLGAMAGFYTAALGFIAGHPRPDPALALLLGVRTATSLLLRRGAQVLELVATDPAGPPIAPGGRSDDRRFQHCALVTADIDAAHARLAGFACTAISRAGPQALPGGIVAFKFRDPEGHPLELIQFPPGPPDADQAKPGGIDHSAIVVTDVARSLAFYAGSLGLVQRAWQVNEGPAQAALDDLVRPVVDVVALAPPSCPPHLELLGYRSPHQADAAGQRPPLPPHALAATRLVFTARPGTASPPMPVLLPALLPVLLHDPDGHAVLIEAASAA